MIQIFMMNDVSYVRRLRKYTLDYAWIYIENRCQDSSRAHAKNTAFDLFDGILRFSYGCLIESVAG